MTQLFGKEDTGVRSDSMKRAILRFFITNGDTTTNDVARELSVSMPTASKLISELVGLGYVKECGKLETDEGRRPQLYGIDPASGYFLGVDFDNDVVNIGLVDFSGHVVELLRNKPFVQRNDMESLDELCSIITDFTNNIEIPKERILDMNVNVSGRVNPKTGQSYSMYSFKDTSLASLITEKTGIETYIDNDSRAMAYGEYVAGNVHGEQNVLFFNVSWGLGLGMILDGKLYNGKSGFAGELGHVHAFDNEVICTCGKKGCLETEVSGSAFHRIVKERLAAGEASTINTDKNGNFTLKDLIDATKNEDWLCIDVVEGIGQKLGQRAASLINILNPDLVVIGGTLSLTGDYLLQAVRSSIIKYSLSLIYKDTKVVLSSLKDEGGVIGACMLARRNALAG